MCVKLFLSDLDAKFSKSIDWADAASGRTGRYALVIDHGKVTYADIETEKGTLKVSFSLLDLMSCLISVTNGHIP